MTELDIENLLTAFTNAVSTDDSLDVSKAEDAARYVQGLHGSRDPVGPLRKDILRIHGGGVFLFAGQSGSGKSTELLRLKRDLIEKGCKVFYCDVNDWLNINAPVTLSSFLVALLSGWVDQLGTLHVQRSPAQRLIDFFTKTQLIPGSLTLKAGEGLQAQMQFALQSDENFRQELEKNLRKQLSSIVAQAHALVADIIQDICPNGEKCVLLADSLEKIQGFGPEADAVYDSIQRLFVGEGAALKLPGAYVVYSVSPYLLEHNNQLAASLGTGDVVTMPSVHVLVQQSDVADQNGIAAVCQVVEKRFARWAEVLTRAQLEHMAQATGGDLRDFLRAIRIAIGGDIATLPIADQEVYYALQRVCPTRNVPGEHLDWMARVQKSHLAELGGDITGRLLQRYLASKHVLAYLNGQNWYSVHPMLRNWVLERAEAKRLEADKAASASSAAPSA